MYGARKRDQCEVFHCALVLHTYQCDFAINNPQNHPQLAIHSTNPITGSLLGA